MSRRLTVLIMVLLVLEAGACTQAVPALGDDAGNPGPPQSLSIDGEAQGDAGADPEGSPDQDVMSMDGPQLPAGVSGEQPPLFPSDWTPVSPFPNCPASELELTGISYLDTGQIMVSFVDPNAGQESTQPEPPAPPFFLNLADAEGGQVASYDCTKNSSAPNLVYCFGDPLPAGSQVKASLASGDRNAVIVYDPTGLFGEGGSADPGRILVGRKDLDSELLFPDLFGANQDYLAGIWGTNGTSLEPALDFVTAREVAASLGFEGQIKTLIGLFNVLSSCQAAADLGSPLPDGCQELGEQYYQPQTDCQGFPGCFQACSEDLGLVSADGQANLEKKELLDTLESGQIMPIPGTCSDYLYWSQGVLFTGSSDGEGGSDWTGSLLSPLSAACILNPDSPFCSDDSGSEEEDVQSIPAELMSAVITGGCLLDPTNPLCTGDWPGGESGGTVPILSKCAAEISWKGTISTYGDAADVITFLLSAGPSLSGGVLPASCQDALEEASAPFITAVPGMLSAVIYSGTVNECVYQMSFTVPPDPGPGGSGGGQSGGGSGSSKPSCGPGLIPVLWQGNWICIPEN